MSMGSAGRAASSAGRRKQLIRKNPTAKASDPALERQESIYFPGEFKKRELPLTYKVKVIKKLDDSVFFFHCTCKGNTGRRFNKNMVVLVDMEQEVLSLVNPIRLSEDGEAKLLELGGEIVNIIRLGPTEHAAFEDDYYLQKFPTIQRWAPGEFSSCPHLPLHHKLWDTTYTKVQPLTTPVDPAVPHPDVKVFCFDHTVQPECVLFYPRKKLVLTGDSLQHQINNPYVNDLAMQWLERHHQVTSAPICLSENWLKAQAVISNNSRSIQLSFRSKQAQRKGSFFVSSGKFKLSRDFARLLKLDISRLISTSGNDMLQEHVKQAIEEAVDKACQLE
jgi:hypothetical protein